MRSAAADNDRRAPEESPDRSGRASSPSTSPIDLIDESLIEDVSLMAGKGPISDRRCVRRRRCRARKPRCILTSFTLFRFFRDVRAQLKSDWGEIVVRPRRVGLHEAT